MEDRDDIWKNVTSRSVLDKKHKKNDISSQIVTSDNDMSELVRKLRGSRDLLQRRSSGDGYIPKEQYSWMKTIVLSEYNLRLPTNHDHFEDGNHQKQVTTLYGILWTGNFQFSEQLLIFCYVRLRSNEDANDSQAVLHFLLPAVER